MSAPPTTHPGREELDPAHMPPAGGGGGGGGGGDGARGSSRASPLLAPYTLLYFYRRRLRAHAVQELFAGLGVAVAVALVFSTTVISSSVTGSTAALVRQVAGPAGLQLRARDTDGLPEALLARAEHLPGVKQAAPLLEQTATVSLPGRAPATVDLAGADTSLVALDGLAHTLPRATLQTGGIGLSTTTAAALSISTASTPVTLALRGRAIPLHVSAVLGREAFGALSGARVAVMPLSDLQRLAGLRGHLTRILVQADPGMQARVRSELLALAGARFTVQAADADLGLLRQALAPSDQASAFFAAISALLGFLFAFNALLLTVPERRRSIADLRLIGARRSAIVQMFLFQTLCLGVAASLLGLLGGYVLLHGVFHQSSAYLAEAFTLGSGTVIGAGPLLIAFIGGVLATCLASALPLFDLRRGRALDAVHLERETPTGAPQRRSSARLASAAAILVLLSTLMFALAPSLALLACTLLALASVLALPQALACVLALAHALAERRERMTILPLALSSLRATTLRSLALAATGAVALFGAVALGGARGDLLRGIGGFAHSYSADAAIWVTNPGDNQAIQELSPALAARDAALIARVPGVRRVQRFQGGFTQLGERRVWVIARPPGGAREVLFSQILSGAPATALARLAAGGWIAISAQIAAEHHTGVGGSIVLPTPTGPARLRIAATTTNLAWSPGVLFIGAADYARLWSSAAPTALAVKLSPAASATPATIAAARAGVARALGPRSGLQAVTAARLQARIDALTGEGLGQLSTISALLLAAAILAMSAALASAIWQRRATLAELRLSGVRRGRLRRILLVESALMLSAGAITGAIAGIYGQLIIDGYLAHVTGFPVARVGASFRPLEIFLLLSAVVLAIAAVPGWLASRVSPILALNE